jgi:general secretion pathway protein C
MMNLDIDARRRLITALLIGGTLLCAGYWTQTALSAWKAPAAKPLSSPAPVALGTPAELARVLGAARPTLAGSELGLAERFRVVGVMASASGQGTALISVDRQPARPFRVGASVAPGFVLKAVTQRQVLLLDSLQAELSLPLPDPTEAREATKATDEEPRMNEAPSNSPPPPASAPFQEEAGPPLLPTIRGAPRAP